MSATIPRGGADANPAAARLGSIIGNRLLVADGSTGTALEAMAPELAAGGRLALLPLERPDIVEALHDAYFAAGADLVETATFSASARDLARFAGENLGGAAALCYGVNRAAAAIAARSARRAESQDSGGSGRAGDVLLAGDGLRQGSRPRLVAGSIGPGDAPPSLGASTYAELFESYLPQARGLADGGADLAIVETCQDPLQIKAALAALGSPEGGRGLPFIVSATVDGRGRMLAGADIAAFVAIVAPFAPLALGLNCSGGPDELEGSLAELAALSPFPLCFMPNAGLPCSSGGCTTYPFGSELFAAKVEALARRFGLAIAGGCCGTTPAHIAALHERLADRPVAAARPPLHPALASLYSARNIGPGLFKIGERANSAGSAAFAALLDAEDFEGMADKALAQEGSGAAAIDLHLSRPGRDEAADLERLVALLAPRAQAALCLDSGDPGTLERVLPLVGGRPLVNSTSLEDPERARRVFALAARFGAAVVCLAMDGAGPARTVADKVRVCRALYDMATDEFGLQPQALLFDPLTFTIAAGGDAAATIAAIGAVKAACPGSLTVLGVGNVSYGLPKSTRAAVTSLFLDAAVRAGLDAAIMDTAGIPAPESIDPGLKKAALAALGLEGAAQKAAGPAAASEEESGDRLDALLAWAAEKAKAGKGAGGATASAAAVATAPGQASRETEPGDPASRLKAALSRGDKASAEALGREVAALRGSVELMGLVTEAMAESGRLWNEGRLSLPLVLRSAEAARRALGPATEGAASSATKGVVVMATVKGDLHDIGKNIVAAILACSGWKVVDLGTDAPAAAIVEAAQERGAIAVGLSGLLTRSLAEMRATCAALAAAGSKCLVLCGGAAVSADFVAREIEPLHPGLVSACPDAFAAAELLDRAEEAQTEARAAAPRPSTPPAAKAAAASRPIAPKARPAYEPPFLGAAEPRGIPFPELLARLSRPTLFAARWGYSRQDFDKAEEELAGLLAEAETLAQPRFVYGYYPVKALGETTLLVGGTAGATLSSGTVFAAPAAAPAPAVGTAPVAAPLELPFPREAGGARRTLTAYFRPEGDWIAFFAATAGPGLGRRARELKDEGKLEAYWHLHGLGSAFAEAAAQYAHDLVGAEILAAGGESAGKRYSFGFPACPGLEYQAPLLELLGARRIGLSVTSGHQLNPEHSVTAFVIARADAAYFGA